MVDWWQREIGVVLLHTPTGRGGWQLTGSGICARPGEVLLVSGSDWWCWTAIVDVRYILLLDWRGRCAREVLSEVVVVSLRWWSWWSAVAFIDGGLSRQEFFQDKSDLRAHGGRVFAAQDWRRSVKLLRQCYQSL